MRVAIYTRVSTGGQTYEQQVEACKNYCKIKGWNDIDVYNEVESSTKDRPIFNECLKRARDGQYKTIVVFRIDRAWRSSRQFIMDFDSLLAKGVVVVSVMEGLDPTTPMGKCMMTIIVALGELERTNISTATKQRLDILKTRKHLGRKPGSKDKNPRRKSGYYNRWIKQRGGKIYNEINPEHVSL